MTLAVDILVTFILLMWPTAMMMSPMVFDAPGSEKDKSKIVGLVFIILYPVLIFGIYKLLDASYFTLSADTVFYVALVVTLGAAWVFGYPRFIVNTLRGIDSSGYFVTDRAVYFDGRRLAGARPDSFTMLTHHYARDAERVFYQGRPIPGADAASFAQVRVPNPASQGDDPTNFWRDQRAVYIDGEVLKGADAQGFEALSWSYGRDAQRVYYERRPLEGARPDQFVLLDAVTGKDHSHVYVFERRTGIDVDAASFELVDDPSGAGKYGRDRHNLYAINCRAATPLAVYPGADPASFGLLAFGYAKDRQRVYYADTDSGSVSTLEGAEAARFAVTGYDAVTGADAGDQVRRYAQGKLLAP